MFMTVKLVRPEGQALMLPEQAIVPENEQHFVYVVADGKAQKREIKIGRRRPGEVEVLQGLSADDGVVIDGTQNLRDGVPVRVQGAEGDVAARWPGERRNMILSDVSVRRPVFAMVLSLLLTIIGLMAAGRLSIRETPNVQPPIVSIETVYRGASASVIETKITQVIENQIAGLEGVDTLRSTSQDERSRITIEFSLDRDIESAANDVRDRVSRVLNNLPLEADPPEVAKVDTTSEPIMWLNLESDRRSQLELTDYAQRYLVDRFSVVKGVAQVRISGERRFAMRVWLDRQALAARKLTVRTSRTRCAPRTSSCLPAASSRASASSRCTPTPASTRRAISASSSSAAAKAATWCAWAKSRRSSSRPRICATWRAPTASPRSAWASSRSPPRTCWKSPRA